MANANADHNVSNRESHATRFEINRMPITHDTFFECTPKQEPNATREHRTLQPQNRRSVASYTD
jgi:hypothetical protein